MFFVFHAYIYWGFKLVIRVAHIFLNKGFFGKEFLKWRYLVADLAFF